MAECTGVSVVVLDSTMTNVEVPAIANEAIAAFSSEDQGALPSVVETDATDSKTEGALLATAVIPLALFATTLRWRAKVNAEAEDEVVGQTNCRR